MHRTFWGTWCGGNKNTHDKQTSQTSHRDSAEGERPEARPCGGVWVHTGRDGERARATVCTDPDGREEGRENVRGEGRRGWGALGVRRRSGAGPMVQGGWQGIPPRMGSGGWLGDRRILNWSPTPSPLTFMRPGPHSVAERWVSLWGPLLGNSAHLLGDCIDLESRPSGHPRKCRRHSLCHLHHPSLPSPPPLRVVPAAFGKGPMGTRWG